MKLLEDSRNGLLHLAVRRLFDSALFGANESDWDFLQCKAATYFLLEGRASALPQQSELELGH
jgi:hypothetical protein